MSARNTVRPPTPESKTPMVGLDENAGAIRSNDTWKATLFRRTRDGARPHIEVASSNSVHIFKRKRNRHIGIFLPANLHVGIDKIIQRRSGLRRFELQIAALGELHSVHIVRAEEIIMFLRMLPGFGDIDRHPAG